MRRIALAALSAALALSACRDQNRESPTEPSATPEGNLLTSCRVTRFPAVRVAQLIVKVFPKGKLRVEAALRAAATALLWDTCKTALARKAAAGFLDFMNRSFGQLTGSQAEKDELIGLFFTGVGLPSPGSIVLGPDFGIGTVDPAATTATRIETEGKTGLIQFEPAQGDRPAAFNEVTVVSIFRHADGFRLDGFPEEDQYPPFWDYRASNTSNNHVVAQDAIVRMAFCLLGTTRFPSGYPDGVRIGHNPDLTVPPPRFEIIPEDPDVVAAFGGALVCNNLQTSLGSFGSGLGDFGRATSRFFGPLIRTLFLPQPLMAVAVGSRGPLGGLPPTLSDFGVVNATSYFGYEDGETAWTTGAGSFWNRRNSTPIANSAYPTYVSTWDAVPPNAEEPAVVVGGTVAPPFRKFNSGWYGQASTGSYIGTRANTALGGTSTAPNSGAFVSPPIKVPTVSGTNVELRFKTWWEIEGVNPGKTRDAPTPVGPFDVMDVYLEAGDEVFLAQLNPETDPVGANRESKAYTSGGFDTAPVWKNMAIDISEFMGQTVQIKFEFTTRDVNFNGFRGWMVEDVRVSTGTSEEPAILLRRIQRSQNNVTPGRDLPPVSR